MFTWVLLQYKQVVEKFLTDCSEEMQEILIRRLDQLSEKGIECKRPISVPLGEGLFELRGRAGNKQARLIYYFSSIKEIIFVHAFFKSGSQVSRHDKEIAERNRAIIREGKEKTHGIDLTH